LLPNELVVFKDSLDIRQPYYGLQQIVQTFIKKDCQNVSGCVVVDA